MSTQVTKEAPRDKNSKAILPVPEQRSKIFKSLRSSWFESKLNKPSLAKSVVGLEGNFLETLKRRPFKLPPIIRKDEVL